MNIIADTKLLVRFLTKDDERQAQKVIEIFTQSSKIIIPTNVLCELVWVLSSSYKFNANFITEKLSKLIENPKRDPLQNSSF